jgi:hypothetical protein
MISVGGKPIFAILSKNIKKTVAHKNINTIFAE